MKRLRFPSPLSTIHYPLFLGVLILFAGCNTLRLAPTESQKQSAWLLKHEAQAVSRQAAAEETSTQLQTLADKTADDALIVTEYFGPPAEPLPVESYEDLTGVSAQAARDQAKLDAARKVEATDIITAADEGLGWLDAVLAAVGVGSVSGVWISKLRKGLQAAQGANQQIVANNDTFLAGQTEEVKTAFKEAQKKQTESTQKIVQEIQAGS